VRCRRRLRERVFRLAEGTLSLVEPILFEQRAPEHQSRIADLLDQVFAPVEDPQRVPGLLLRLQRVAGAQVHLRHRRDGGSGVVIPTDLERGGERLLQVVDRLLGPAEQELDPAKVVVQPGDVALLGQHLELRLRLLAYVRASTQ
jgi:hypothetical protein